VRHFDVPTAEFIFGNYHRTLKERKKEIVLEKKDKTIISWGASCLRVP
jgi:hypothetical protein